MSAATETQNETQPTPIDPPSFEAPWLTFPPFPGPPPGVTLIPFSEFKPTGLFIRMEEDDGPEIDPLGIPTVTLLVKHALTEEEQIRKKKKRKTTVKIGGEVRRLIWYEEWEEGEHMRRCTTNPLTSRVDRLHQAVQDFRSISRSWPPPTTGVPQLWDAFRLYIGILSRILPPPSKRRQFQQDEGGGGDDDDDDAPGDVNEVEMVNNEEEVKQRRQKRQEEEKEKRKKDFDDAARARAERRGELKEQRMEYFFNDPELAMKEFFSAHFRDKGLVWDEKHCKGGPILVEFFLNFVIRSNVFPEYDRELRRAVDIVKKAKFELPLTFQVGKAIPDLFNVGCEYLFGNMTNALVVWEDVATETKKEEDKDETAKPEEKNEEPATTQEEPVDPIAIDAEPTITIIDPNDPSFQLPLAVERDAVADNVDINGIEVAPTSGWGDISNWTPSTTENQTSAWGDTNGGWDDPTIGTWDASEITGPSIEDDWLPTHQKSLTDLFGPTVFPMTHTTGVIERSTRRILRVVDVPPKAAGGKKKKTRSPAGAVEEDLERLMGYVVLGPWKKVGNDVRSDITPPIILPDSRGPTTLDDPETSPAPKPDAHIHDPAKDEITVLIEPKACEKLKDAVGMGVLATWIQLARTDTEATEEWAGLKKNGEKKGAPGVNGQTTKWWYMEQVMATFVSFHTDRYYPDQDD
ncbi:hypothetical protein QCA50_000767 [Cerrena zonata]|uniref:Uncharacterized protein n=1 Tax=Cerrena zonata TaxID=2478898 RepID=A0AAW0GXC0_9APHY